MFYTYIGGPILQTKIRCNGCGRELDFWDLQQNFTIHKRVEYGSIYDESVVDLRLCCDCFDILAQACAVSPIHSEAELASEGGADVE